MTRRSLPLAGTRYTPAVLAAIAEGEARAARLLLEGAIAEVGGAGGGAGGEAGVVEAARQSAARGASLAEAAVAREPPARPIACKAGCPSCCTAKVLVVAPEVLRLAAHLRATLGPEALAAVAERVRRADERTRGRTRAERAEAQIFCPLLVEGSCSVHPARPLVCGGWSSMDASACERDHATGALPPTAPIYAPQHELASAVLAGLGKGCFDAGLDGTPLELVAALRIALERPAAGGRWLRRLPVFSQARDVEWMEQNAPGAGGG